MKKISIFLLFAFILCFPFGKVFAQLDSASSPTSNNSLVANTPNTATPSTVSSASNPSSPQTFTKNLKIGSKGDDVKMLQQLLQDNDFLPASAKIDGSFGKLTSQAVMKYQKANGLKADGSVGPKTIANLNTFILSQNTSNKNKTTNTSKNPPVVNSTNGTINNSNNQNTSNPNPADPTGCYLSANSSSPTSTTIPVGTKAFDFVDVYITAHNCVSGIRLDQINLNIGGNAPFSVLTNIKVMLNTGSLNNTTQLGTTIINPSITNMLSVSGSGFVLNNDSTQELSLVADVISGTGSNVDLGLTFAGATNLDTNDSADLPNSMNFAGNLFTISTPPTNTTSQTSSSGNSSN